MRERSFLDENHQKGATAMQIEELTLHTQYLADQKAFYHTLLGLPLLIEAADGFRYSTAR